MTIISTRGNELTIRTDSPICPTRLFHITDTHLSLDDERGDSFRDYSQRMAGAYLSNVYFQNGEMQSAAESFTQTLAQAKAQNVDFIALTGDIFSFPSEAAVAWAYQQLNDTAIPWAYISGNHDWHYEGMPGSEQSLRDIWSRERLNIMYQGRDPLYAAYDLNGLRLVFIDNSTYEILPEQLAFFRDQVSRRMPFLLFMHIPLYVPGRHIGYGCGHPDWGAATDHGWEIERREKWREGGHTQVTFDFHKEVFEAPNLLAILVGHTHVHTLDFMNGIPQVVSTLNATGYYLDVRIQTGG